MQARVFQEHETKSRPRHGHAQLAHFSELPGSAWARPFVAEMVLGVSNSKIDLLRKAGILEWRKNGRSVEIRVASIRAAQETQ